MSHEMHYGPVWSNRQAVDCKSFAACKASAPSTLTTHKPWVTCDACKQTDAFKRASA